MPRSLIATGARYYFSVLHKARIIYLTRLNWAFTQLQ